MSSYTPKKIYRNINQKLAQCTTDEHLTNIAAQITIPEENCMSCPQILINNRKK